MYHIQILDDARRKREFKTSEADEKCEFKTFKTLLSALMGNSEDSSSTSSSNFSLCTMTGLVAVF